MDLIINIIIGVIIFLSFTLFIFKFYKTSQENFTIRYRKCSKLPVVGIMKSIFDEHQINLNNNWNLYFK